LAGIYIHIPFCKQACHYCNFHFSTNLKSKKIIIDSIIKEIKLKSKFENEEIETIYFGGGTPTLLTSLETEAILNCIYKYYKVKSESEITIEANPDDIRIDRLKFLKKLSFNRLSIGVQSFIDSELKLMNRAHNSHKAIRSVEVSKSIFNNISVDLLYGLPDSNIETLDQNINILLNFDIKHISSYALTLEPKTALEKFIKKGLVELPNDDIVFEQFKHVNKKLISNDYINYELSSFAKQNFFSKNNTGYWLRKKYTGIGPSAHSYNGLYRSWNISNNKKYIDQIQSGKLFYKKEILSKVDQYNEYIMTGLRTMWGISIKFIENKFGKNFKNHFLKSIKKYIDQKLIHISNDMYITTDSARFLADGIAADLFIIDLSE
jgi:oxygen-independent coproporphyrinogen-3 oxidase